MAKDQMEAMKILGIPKADFYGISQGGMIAQYIAIDYPDLVNRLVLAVTLSKQNEIIQKVVDPWMEMAKLENYKGIIIDTAEKSYSESYLKNIVSFILFLEALENLRISQDFLYKPMLVCTTKTPF